MKTNVIIGKLLCGPEHLFAFDREDWETNEKENTLVTDERFLPRIMVETGMVDSISEVRRNKPQLCITLDKIDFICVRWGKKRLHIAIGE